MAKTAAQALARWQANASAAQPAYTEGVQGTDVDVMARAVAAKGAMVQGFTNSVTSGAWERGINASGGTANWKQQSVAKAANYGVGIAAGASKYGNALGKLIPFMDNLRGSLPARVPGNIESSIARSAAMQRGLHAAKGQFKG